MADDRNMLARNAAAQGGLYAARRWAAPWAGSARAALAERLSSDSFAYARALASPAVRTRAARVATMLSERAPQLGADSAEYMARQKLAPELIKSSVRRVGGEAAVRGMEKAGVIRFATDHVVLPDSTVAPGLAKWLGGLHSPYSHLAKSAATKGAGSVRKVASKAFKWVNDAGYAVQSGLANAIPSTGLTGGRLSGFLRGTVKQTVSKSGLAAGFAVAGIMDAGEALYGFARSDGKVRDLTKNDWAKVGRGVLSRVAQGALRGLDGALFGLPSLVPGYDKLTSEDYMDPSADMFAKEGSARATYLQAKASLGDSPSAAALAKVEREYQRMKENDYAAGKDEFGDDEGISDAAKSERKREIERLRAGTARMHERAGKLLYEYDRQANPDGPDGRSIRDALTWLRGDVGARATQIQTLYGDDAAFRNAMVSAYGRGSTVPRENRPFHGDKGRVVRNLVNNGDWEGLSRFRGEEMASAMGRLNDEVLAQVGRLTSMPGYGAFIKEQEGKARGVFTSIAKSRGYRRDEAEKMFNESWAGMNDYSKGTLDMQEYRNALLAEPAAEEGAQ